MREEVSLGQSGQMKVLSRDAIKYIGMFTMLLNHIANIFMTRGTLLHQVMIAVGFFTAPVMLYFLVEGYHLTHSRLRYFLRLFFFALLSEVPFCLAFGLAAQGRIVFCGMNMLFTLCLCFALIWAMENIFNEMLRLGIVIAVILASTVFAFDWGYFAPMFTLLFLRAWRMESRPALAAAFGIPAVLFGLEDVLSFFIMYKVPLGTAAVFGVISAAAIMLAGICILYLYNGRRAGRGRTFSKWFFYLFYPLHLCVLAAVKLLAA